MITEVVKICGVNKTEILRRLDGLSDSGVKFDVVEDCLDAKITMSAPKALGRHAFEMTKSAVYNLFEEEVYSSDDISLQELAGKLLKMNGRMLAVAESLTGGEICSRLTEVAGISENFYEGIVCYNSMSKMIRLGVGRDTLSKYGAISRQTAYEMVRGIACQPENVTPANVPVSGANIGLATTGLAGPKGDEGKPVGLVYIGVGGGDFITVFERHFEGTRNEIRKCAANVALFYLVRYLNGSIWVL